MIIGFAGLAGSGKDTSSDILVRKHNFAKVALADPLKRICREVFNFTDEQLWGPSESRNAPDPRYVRMKKGALGTTITEWNKEKRTYDTKPSPEDDIFLTPRHALQQLGTEWARSCFGDVWVQYTLRIAKALLHDPDYTYLYTAKLGLHDRQPGMRVTKYIYNCKQCSKQTTFRAHQSLICGSCGAGSDSLGGCQNVFDRPYDGVAISDVRFKNEIDAIHAAGGKVFRMMRGTGLSGAAGEHRSETEQQGLDDDIFDGVIDNREWTLEQLESYIDQIAWAHVETHKEKT